MSRDIWNTLLKEVDKAHKSLPAIQAFCDFPCDLIEQDVTHHHIPGADLMASDPGLFSDRFAELRDALIAAAPYAQWRETYKGSGLDDDFLDRFACYEVMGVDAPFGAADMRGFLLYQPAGLHYPWHHHPAEELYVVIAGEAEFAIEGQETRILRSGDTSYHASNVPHALTTKDHPIMAYVLWRGDLKTKPVLTYPDDIS